MVVRDKSCLSARDGVASTEVARKGKAKHPVMAVFSPIQLLASIPPVTRTFAAATVSLSLFYLYLQWRIGPEYTAPYLTLVPGSSLFYPWTFFTSVFVETTILEVGQHAPHGHFLLLTPFASSFSRSSWSLLLFVTWSDYGVASRLSSSS